MLHLCLDSNIQIDLFDVTIVEIVNLFYIRTNSDFSSQEKSYTSAIYMSFGQMVPKILT